MDSLAPSSDGALLQPRNYQLEMLTDSLKRNIIVAVSEVLIISEWVHQFTQIRWIQVLERLKCPRMNQKFMQTGAEIILEPCYE